MFVPLSKDLQITVGGTKIVSMIDTKGKGVPVAGLKRLKIATKIKKGSVAGSTAVATITMTYSKLGMVLNGLDTEGVDYDPAYIQPKEKRALNVQAVMTLGGVACTAVTFTPVTFSVTGKNNGFGTLAGRSGN